MTVRNKDNQFFAKAFHVAVTKTAKTKPLILGDG